MKQLFTLRLWVAIFNRYAYGYSILGKRDSLERLLTSMPHDLHACKWYRISRGWSKPIPTVSAILGYAVARSYRTESQIIPNAGTALYFQIIYYYNQNELDSVIQKIEKMGLFVREGNLWDYYFDAQRCQIDLYSYRADRISAINKSLEMYQKAQEANNVRG